MKERRLTDIGIELAGDLPAARGHAVFDDYGIAHIAGGEERRWRDMAEELYNEVLRLKKGGPNV